MPAYPDRSHGEQIDERARAARMARRSSWRKRLVMMRRISSLTEVRLIPILLTVLLAFAAGCASTPEAEPVDDTGVDSEFSDGEVVVVEEEVVDTTVAASDVNISPVYFDFDKYDIKAEFESMLRMGADGLKASDASVVIEGHTDERGSEEYNFALGERRAGAVRKYLYNLGVPMRQMSIVSYGEAQPAVQGSGEAVWKLNRRAEFRIR
jgi:peptidoglycan-associated lipoprotein